MTSNEIAYHRLYNQQISHKKFSSPEDVVRWMTAIQAQDYYASLWAIAVRSSSPLTRADVEQTITVRKIVRTWPMRGTLHFVPAEDARWILNLLTPRALKSSKGRRKELELDQPVLNKSRALLEKHLQGEKSLTRAALYNVLEENEISTEGQRGYHIILYLAQHAVICFGARQDKQHTFVLFDEWIPGHKSISGDEALAELASRYIKSRGPATEYDFAAWSGLTVTTARKALAMTENKFEKTDLDGQTYWFPEPAVDVTYKPATHLLPAFDEIICGYKDRSTILESAVQKSIILRNGILKPVIILDGKVVGRWKRTLKKDKVEISCDFFDTISKKTGKAIREKGSEYARFLEVEAVINSNEK